MWFSLIIIVYDKKNKDLYKISNYRSPNIISFKIVKKILIKPILENINPERFIKLNKERVESNFFSANKKARRQREFQKTFSFYPFRIIYKIHHIYLHYIITKKYLPHCHICWTEVEYNRKQKCNQFTNDSCSAWLKLR